jgi:CheY-like chemotaxis protein
MVSPDVSARILVVEDDPDILDTVSLALEDAGYPTIGVSSPGAALGSLSRETFAVVVTDLFRLPDGDPLDAVRLLLRRAAPTPVLVMTAWQIERACVVAEGFADCIAKPFNLNHLLACVAAAVRVSLKPSQRHRAALVQRYFAALADGDMAALEALCSPDVRYVLPHGDSGEPAPQIAGRAAYLAYVAERLGRFRGARFTQVRVYGLPRGLAARYTLEWQDEGGAPVAYSGAVVFHFARGQIKEIGVRLAPERLRRLEPGPVHPQGE